MLDVSRRFSYFRSIRSSIEDIDAPFLTETRATINDGYFKVVSYTTESKDKTGVSMKQTIIYVGLDVDGTQPHARQIYAASSLSMGGYK